MEILLGIPETLYLSEPDKPFDDPPTVTVTRDSDGELVLDAVTADEDEGTYKVTLPAQDQVDRFNVEWVGEISGSVGTYTTTVETVGAFLVTLKQIKSSLEDAAVPTGRTPTDREIERARVIAHRVLEDACEVAFRPRYARESIELGYMVRLPQSKPIKILSAQLNHQPLTFAGDGLDITFPRRGHLDICYVHGFDVPPPTAFRPVLLMARHLLLEDPDDLDSRATSKSNDLASWTLVTPGVRGAITSLPEVNTFIAENTPAFPRMSVVFQAKERIMEIFEETFEDTEVEVVWGKPNSKQAIGMWEAETEAKFTTIGPQPVPLDEDFDIRVGIEAIAASGPDVRYTEEQAWGIFDTASAALRADLHLDGITFFTRPAKGRQEYFQSDNSQGCRIWLTIAGKARI